jgi:SAM-dependent methyltransferase
MRRLKTIDFTPAPVALPKRLRQLLDDADARVERFMISHRDSPVASFVPSDFVLVYQALVAIESLQLAPGQRFVEWGSGVGVVTCLAAELGWDAVGIEIESDLTEAALGLAEDYEIECQFVNGSFVPAAHEDIFEELRDFNWVRSGGADAYDELELEPDDFDLVFCYPWPGEEELCETLFSRCGGRGALLLSYHGQEGVKLRRCV